MGHQVSLEVSFLTLQCTITIDVQWCTSAIVQAYTHTLSPHASRSVWVTFWTSGDSTGAPFTYQSSKWYTKWVLRYHFYYSNAPLPLMFNGAPVLLSRPTHTLSPRASRSVWVTFWTSGDSTGAPFTYQSSKWRTK